MHVPQTEVVLRHDGAELARITLPPGEYVIGRSTDAAICADTPLLSRQHARLALNFDSILIEDLGSSNGTFVGDQPVSERTRLFPNQSVRLGDVSLEVQRQRTESSPEFSLAPVQKTIRRHLPPEILTDKRYAIGSIVARGGMGAILDARQNATKRTVAMKVMLDTNDEADVLRFIAEAQVTAQLDHPNIVPIYELGVDEQDQLFYTMKMVKGITLKKVLELLAAGTEATVKKFPLPMLLTVFQKVCDAVAFAHSKGVIHRDLKPENIMIGDFGSVLVMDWGLAKVLRNEGNPARETTPVADLTRSLVASARDAEPALGSTLDGTIMGTPQYMAPEQARGEIDTLDQRADIYALGAILYHLLALRPSVSGKDAMELVGKVARGEIEPLECAGPPALWHERSDAVGEDGDLHHHGKPATAPPPAAKRQRAGALQKGRSANRPIPASLAAVVRKAMTFDKAARYRSTEDLQADILAYQNGFATSAEKAGAWKQFTLLVKRHKAASIGLAALLVVSIGFTAKVIAEGRRAERGEAKANAALADLKASAPALLQLAESEADSQRFASALGKLDAALALDPALLRARWQRAWVLLALERWSEAAAALRLARQHDPAAAKLASILPAVEQVAAAAEAGRWKSDAAREVFAHLQTVEATGPALAFSGKLKLGATERLKLADQRLLAALGKGNYTIQLDKDGLLFAHVGGRPLRSLEPLRSLPIDALTASDTPIVDLEPLRGMRLARLSLHNCPISDLSPLQGMPLRTLGISGTKVKDLSPLRGAPLEIFECIGIPAVDYTPLRGAPLREANVSKNVADLGFLTDAPIELLSAYDCPLSDLSPLRGKPLSKLDVKQTKVSDLSPLRGAPIIELAIQFTSVKDLTPLLDLPKLEKLRVHQLGKAFESLRRHPTLQYIAVGSVTPYRPVAEFWADYDALQAAEKK